MNNIYKIFNLLTALMSAISLMAAGICVYFEKTIILDWEILFMNSASVMMSIIIDWMTLIFLSAVMLITSAICNFSFYYMKDDLNKTRFMLLIMLFVSSMVFLIISPNVISILLGWDGLGLTSYVLVVYYQNESSCNAGMLTILSNRIGDVCILMVIAIMSYAGTWNFFCLNELSTFMICIFIVLAAMTKSAQIPFSAWLPAAMAAPTPVSALVHSSTLVTAGVYLLIRFFHLLENSMILQMLLVFSVMTMIMAGWGANFEVDLKKIVALSTLSQLGVMMMILSLGMKNIAFFHMISHAMFKSTLFMAAGVMIHMSNSTQDSRFMSNMYSSSPLLMTMFSVMNLSLLGFPFLSGFFSKDMSLEFAFSNLFNIILVILIILATGMTVSYSLRIMSLAMTNTNNTKSSYSLEDSDKTVVISMSVLFFMGVMMGYYFSWSVMWVPCVTVMTTFTKYMVLLVTLMGGVLALLIMKKQEMSLVRPYLTAIVSSSSKMWNLPFLSTKYEIKLAMTAGALSSVMMDKGWLESYPSKKSQTLLTYYSQLIQSSQLTVLISAYLTTFMVLIYLISLI
uniref:NADH-ubiquinone oxidoreductase chain 5 n=1 Tax=Hyalella franciscae TaxID=2759777 RepID=A0A7T8V7N5_9CRUS|nr:NADH dehydrogenase subunit 5 [Hyalella franciscae]